MLSCEAVSPTWYLPTIGALSHCNRGKGYQGHYSRLTEPKPVHFPGFVCCNNVCLGPPLGML